MSIEELSAQEQHAVGHVSNVLDEYFPECSALLYVRLPGGEMLRHYRGSHLDLLGLARAATEDALQTYRTGEDEDWEAEGE